MKDLLIVKVWCLPERAEDDLLGIHQAIVKAVENVSEFGLKGADSMLVLFPTDMMRYGLGFNIFIETTVFFPPSMGDGNPWGKLARSLKEALAKFFPESEVISLVEHTMDREYFRA